MIYLDNAATTFKKPREVFSSVYEFIRKQCGNPGRSTHTLALKTNELIFMTREKISTHLGVDCPERVVFFQNATHALNFAIKTTLKDGDHVIISDIEHNATLRPIYTLEQRKKITYSVFSSSGKVEENIRKLILHNTACIVACVQSNVFGREIEIEKLISVSNQTGIPLILDAAQFIGHKKIDISKANDLVLCAPGHKGLFGIQGSGFCILKNSRKYETIIEGGSGSDSKNKTMPDEPPERYEAGTLSCPSIISMLYGIEFIEKISTEAIEEKITQLTEYALDCLSCVKGMTLYKSGGGIIPFNVDGMPPELVSYELNKRGIYTRAGLHCAPLAHKTLGTYDIGTVRASLSYFNKKSDITKLCKAIKEIQSI